MPSQNRTIGPAEDGAQLLTVLRRAGFSTGMIRRLKQPGGLLLDGAPCTVRTRVCAGQTLTLTWQEAPSAAVAPAPLPLNVVYEDDHLLAVNKPAGMPVHPSAGHRGDTLANAFAAAYPRLTFRPVNRLDRYTTGLVLIAKTPMAAAALGAQLRQGQVQKTYWAVTEGLPNPPAGRIDAPIGRVPGSVLKRQIDPAGKPAVTDYAVLETRGDRALVEVRPHTGRTHQIRVHMARLGCPLAGDWLYGKEEPGKTFLLHCRALAFTHPATVAPLTLQAEAPPDFWPPAD